MGPGSEPGDVPWEGKEPEGVLIALGAAYGLLEALEESMDDLPDHIKGATVICRTIIDEHVVVDR